MKKYLVLGILAVTISLSGPVKANAQFDYTVGFHEWLIFMGLCHVDGFIDQDYYDTAQNVSKSFIDSGARQIAEIKAQKELPTYFAYNPTRKGVFCSAVGMYGNDVYDIFSYEFGENDQ